MYTDADAHVRMNRFDQKNSMDNAQENNPICCHATTHVDIPKGCQRPFRVWCGLHNGSPYIPAYFYLCAGSVRTRSAQSPHKMSQSCAIPCLARALYLARAPCLVGPLSSDSPALDGGRCRDVFENSSPVISSWRRRVPAVLRTLPKLRVTTRASRFN